MRKMAPSRSVEILAGFPFIGDPTAVTSCQVEIAIGSESQATSVMPSGWPFENYLLRFRRWPLQRGTGGDPEPGQTTSLRVVFAR